MAVKFPGPHQNLDWRLWVCVRGSVLAARGPPWWHGSALRPGSAVWAADRGLGGQQRTGGHQVVTVATSAPKISIRRFVITEKAPTRAFSWLKAATAAFTFKTLLRHYAKRALTPRSLNVKLGPRCNYHKGRAAIRHYANQTARPL